MHMRRLICALLVLSVAAAFATSAWAGSVAYYASRYWSPGQGAGSAFSSSWWQSAFSKPYGFDTTVAFIDNTSYSWRYTLRGYQTWQQTYWFSSTVKKAHCHSNVYASHSLAAVCVATS